MKDINLNYGYDISFEKTLEEHSHLMANFQTKSTRLTLVNRDELRNQLKISIEDQIAKQISPKMHNRTKTIEDKMKDMQNTAARQEIIAKMIELVQRDAPWVWGLYPKDFSLHHQWVRLSKPSAIGNNTYKYHRMNPKLRAELRQAWNQPITWPLKGIGLGSFIIMLPVFISYWRRQRRNRR